MLKYFIFFQKNYLFFIFLTPFFLIFYPVVFFQGYIGKRFLFVIILLAVQLALLFRPVFKLYIEIIATLTIKIKLILAFLFLFGLISCVSSEFLLYSLGDYFQYVLLLNAFFIVLSVFSLYPQFKNVFVIVIVAGLLFSNIEFLLLCFIGLGVDGFLDAQQVYPNFGNMRFYNQVQVQLIFVVCALACVNFQYKKYFVMLGATTIFMVLIGGGRGVLLSLGIVCLISLFFSNKKIKELNMVLFYMALIALVFYVAYVFYEMLYVVGQGSTDVFRLGGSGRINMWQEALSGIVNNPLGIGPYQYVAFSNNPAFSHPHNFTLLFFLEWGWVAGFLLMILLVKFSLYVKKIFEFEGNLFKLALGLSLMSACLYGQLGGLFVMPASQIIFVFLLAAFFSENWACEKKSLSVSYKIDFMPRLFVKQQVLIMSFVLVISFGYGFYVVETYKRSTLSIEESSAVNKAFVRGPRMWTNGAIVKHKK
jgi:O-antigen ligase